jgi:hypothetical protein
MTEKFTAPLQWNLPLSGAVTMPITMPNFSGAQFGLFNIDLGASADPALERKLIDHAGSYGKQLGRICDIISEILLHIKPDTPLDAKTVEKFRDMATLINATKKSHKS